MLSIFSRKPRHIPFDQLMYTRDCHTHLLPHVDDGRFSPELCMEQLTAMEAVGVQEVCFTPHVIFGVYPNETSVLKERFDQVVHSYKGGMRLYLGAEYMVDELFLDRIEARDLLTLPGKEVLMDMSYVAEAEWINQVLFEIRLLGLTPILAHPERYLYLADHLERFDQYASAGAKFQLNLLSLSGVYGKASRKIIQYLLQKGYYGYIGTDLHSVSQWKLIRSSKVPVAYAKEGERLGLWKVKESAK